jgi:chromosome segregation ATPase
MKSRMQLGWTWAVCLLALLAAAKLPLAGQEQRPREDVLQALLAEVRALRVALEQTAAAGPRVQLAVGRLQILEQRLNTERRRLDDVRDGITNGEREAAETKDRLAMIEDALQRAADPGERESLTAQLKMAKGVIAQKAAELQRLREQESELAGTVAAEESRWAQASQQLDDLERALSPRR